MQHGLLTHRDEQQQSQLLILDLSQEGIQHHQDAWQAVGMQHTVTARLELDQVEVEKVAARMPIWIGPDSGTVPQVWLRAGMAQPCVWLNI